MRRLLLGSFAVVALASFARAQAPVFSDEFQVNTAITSAQYGATTANLGPSGNFVVTWNDEGGADGDSYGVRGRLFDVTGSPLGGEFTVTAFGTNNQGYARVGSNANGDFVVTWTEGGTLPGGSYQIYARRFNSTGAPQGGNIAVNTYTTNVQAFSSVALDSTGNFVVVWRSTEQDGSDFGVFGQLFDNAGAKVGAEFQVNQQTTGPQRDARVARRPTGEFLVVWRSPQDAQAGAIMARRYAANGTPSGGEFQVNTRELGYQYIPDAAYFADGSAIIVWTSYAQDGSNGGVYGQRLDASGVKLGPEFNVNTFTTGFQGRPAVATGPDGDFAVIWQSEGQDGSSLAVRAQQFDATGKRLGVELPVNAFTTGLQGAPAVAAQPNGQYVAVWDSENDGDGSSVAARLAGFPAVGPILVDVPHDTVAEGASNINGVLEPDEAAIVEPSFTNNSEDSLPLSGTASNLRGLPGPTYTLIDTSADYGTITAGATFDCFLSTGDCYSVMVSGTRPAQHWDAIFDETLSYESFTRTASLHVGGSFPDVPQNAFYPFIENLFHNGVTGGCAGGGYCPTASVTRAQMAVFLLKARWGSLFIPAPATGTAFPDVPAGNAFAPWIEELVREGITAGCGGGLYCPNNPVTRQQMAIFLLKTREGSAYAPPPGTGIFGDVVGCPNPACDFIEDLYNQGITGGCQASPLLYCPTNSVLRQQMAVFLVKTFGLLLYGP
jgi:S-layer homology domain